MNKEDRKDLVERLRDMAGVETSALYSQRKTMNEAADEITRLRCELSEERSAYILAHGMFVTETLRLRNALAAAAEPAGYAEITEPYRAALRMIREAIETLFGPAANLESEEAELLRGPEPHHTAEAVIAALQNVAGGLSAPPGAEVVERMRNDPCVQKLQADEPFFVLLGRDPDAAHALSTWINYRLRREGRSPKTDAAEATLNRFSDFREAREARAALSATKQDSTP